MNVLVDTDEGVANICGDVVYDVVHQLISPHLQRMELDPAVTGNHGGSKRGEKAVIEHGRVIGRTFDRVPGPLISNEEWRGKLTRQNQKVEAG